MTQLSGPLGAHRIKRRDMLKLVAAVGAVGTAGAFGLAAPALGQSARTLRFGHMGPTSTIYHQAIELFGNELSKLSSGKFKLEIFPSSQLGPIAEMLQSVQDGTLDFSMAVPAWFSNFSKPLDVFALPYLVHSTERLKTALEGEIGDDISTMTEEAGLKVVGYWLMGQRHIINRLRPVTTPADTAGLKLRVINSEIHMATFKALGASPVAMDPAELYLALQQGVVDGFEFPLPDAVDQKMYEVAPYVSLDGHTTDFFLNAVSPRTWKSLSQEEQDMVRAAMKVAMDWQWEAQPKDIERARGELDKVATVTDISPEDKALFVEATKAIHQQFADVIGKEWLAKVSAAVSSA